MQDPDSERKRVDTFITSNKSVKWIWPPPWLSVLLKSRCQQLFYSADSLFNIRCIKQNY